MNKTKKKINQWPCYNRIWSWSPMLCEKHGPRVSVTTKTLAFGLGFCLLRPSGHVFHTAWETMIKSYNSGLRRLSQSLELAPTSTSYVHRYLWEQWAIVTLQLLAAGRCVDDVTIGHQLLIIGIDHDRVWAGVVGTAIRNSTSCAGRRGRAGRHNECCSGLQYQPRQRRPHKWSISILPRSQFSKSKGNLRLSTSCTAVRLHRRLRNDAWRRDRSWRHNWYVTSQSRGHEPRAQRQTLVFTPKVA